MTPDKLKEYKIAAFLDAVKRSRWFLLATVIASTLILAQSYLTCYSYADQRMEALIADQLSRNLDQKYTQEEKRIARRLKSDDGPGPEIWTQRQLERYARDRLAYLKGTHELSAAKSSDRALWLLSFSVPEEDFVPVMGLMLAVLCIALWLSVRAMVQTLTECDDGLLLVARLNLLFPVATGQSRQDTIAKVIQGGSVWMPFAVFLWATVKDLIPLLGGLSGGDHLALTPPGQAVLSRLCVLVVILFVLGLTAFASSVKVQEMDTMLQPSAAARTPSRHAEATVGSIS
jgi:hypothetical protein